MQSVKCLHMKNNSHIYCILVNFAKTECKTLLNRPLQNVEVLAALNFQIPCFRPETPALYLRSLPTNPKGHG